MKVFLALGLLGAMAASGACAQSLPQYVKGPLSGFAYECQQEKQPFDAHSFVTAFDLDGDGKPDHVFDIAKGCLASRLLYCNETEGCLIDVFLSGEELKMAGLKVRAFRPGRSDGRPALILTLTGSACGAATSPCEKAMVWNGQALELK